MAGTILTAPAWMQYGDRVTGDNDPTYGVNGTINADSKILWGYEQTLYQGIDTLIVEWVSTTSAKVLSGGFCWADDGEQGYKLTSDHTVTLSGLSASSAYFLWIGEVSSAVDIKVGSAFDDSSVPSGMTHSHRIPGWFLTDGSGNVIQFSNSPVQRLRSGEIIAWAGTYPPYGALVADNSARTRTGAPFDRGFALFSTAYGVGDGSTTYNIPGLRGRTPIGAGTGSGLTARTLGATLGEEGHSQTEAENGTHDHGVYAGDVQIGTGTTSAQGTGNTFDTDTSGSGTAHNTMQPSTVINYVLAL